MVLESARVATKPRPPRPAALPGAALRPLETAQTQPNAPPSASARLSPSANNVYFSSSFSLFTMAHRSAGVARALLAAPLTHSPRRRQTTCASSSSSTARTTTRRSGSTSSSRSCGPSFSRTASRHATHCMPLSHHTSHAHTVRHAQARAIASVPHARASGDAFRSL